MSLLSVDNLSVGYRSGGRMVKAVEQVSFSIDQGRSLGFVGESGCGKTTIGMALMGLLPDNGRILSGRILLDGKDLTAMDPESLRRTRGREVAMIFQAAMNALNPVMRVGDQIREMIQAHEDRISEAEMDERIESLFDLVEIPRKRINDFPHQYSGGMKQRAVIAMAMACHPRLIIADEPTTALDVVVQDQILTEIEQIRQTLNTSFVFISHDIAVVARVCDQICIMVHGRIVEAGTRKDVFDTPMHPYTRQLLASYLSLDNCARMEVPQIPAQIGAPPVSGCVFSVRCPHADERCRTNQPDWNRISETHGVSCFMAEKTVDTEEGSDDES